MRSKFTIAQGFAMAPLPCADTIFPGFAGIFPGPRGVHSVVKRGGVVETLRRSNSLSRSVLVRLGPLGSRQSTPLISEAGVPRSQICWGLSRLSL